MNYFGKDVSLTFFVKKLIYESPLNKKLRYLSTVLKFVDLVPYLNVTQILKTAEGNLDKQCTFFIRILFTTVSKSRNRDHAQAHIQEFLPQKTFFAN